MKKIYAFAAFAAALSMLACNKENGTDSPKGEIISVDVSYEDPIEDPDTKLSISESGTKFTLLFDGTESMTVGNTSNSTTTSFSTSSSGSRSATFTGSLPSVTGTKTDYIGIVSTFGSVAAAGIRASVAHNQTYNGASVASSSLLVGRTDDCTVGNLSDVSLKTMNAYLKFSLIKGSAAPGSSNNYASHMYVKNIVVESVNGEQIAGKFGIAKTGSDWADSYIDDAGIAAGDKKDKITLDCTNNGASAGVDLSAAATDFYIAIAFGTYAKGLKVTINVQNAKDGDTGKIEAYISKNSSYDIARNTIVAMPALTVNPEDTSEIILWSESWDGGTDGSTPTEYLSGSHSGMTLYSGSVSYTQSASTTLKTESLAGGSSPELYMAKSGSRSFTVSGIPTAGASTVSVSYKANNGNNTVTCSTAGTSVSGSSGSFEVTTGGASTLTLVFANTGSKATRIDDIVVAVAD